MSTDLTPMVEAAMVAVRSILITINDRGFDGLQVVAKPLLASLAKAAYDAGVSDALGVPDTDPTPAPPPAPEPAPEPEPDPTPTEVPPAA